MVFESYWRKWSRCWCFAEDPFGSRVCAGRRLCGFNNLYTSSVFHVCFFLLVLTTASDLGFILTIGESFSRSCHTGDLKTGTPVATRPDS